MSAFPTLFRYTAPCSACGDAGAKWLRTGTAPALLRCGACEHPGAVEVLA